MLAVCNGIPEAADAQETTSRPVPDGRSVLFEGVALSPQPDGGTPALYRFELGADSVVTVTSLGRAELDVGPLAGFPDLPAGADTVPPLRVSAGVLMMMAEQVEGALAEGPAPNVFGVSFSDGHARVRLERGAPVALLALALVALVGVSVGTTVLALGRRERRRRETRLAAQRHRIEASEAERSRLAREIHDGPLQDLHAIRARAEAQRRTSGLSGDAATDEADRTLVMADEVGGAARELRAIAEGLRPPALGRFGLAAALASHAARFTERQPHVRIRVHADDDGQSLPEPARAALFRIAQEAISNAVRHGQARSIEVEYAVETGLDGSARVRLEIRDDGGGLAAPPDPAALVRDGHFGLVGMQERATLLGGVLTLASGTVRSDSARSGPDGEDRMGGPSGSGPGVSVRFVVPWHSVATYGLPLQAPIR